MQDLTPEQLAELQKILAEAGIATDTGRKYVGKYLNIEQANSLCKLLGIPASTGGTAIFRAMLGKILAK